MRLKTPLKIAVFLIMASGLFGMHQLLLKNSSAGPDVQTYTEETFLSVLGKAPVAVDFTADWCPTCKVLEKSVLTPVSVSALSKKYGVRFLTADLTASGSEGERLLRKLGCLSIPVLAVFPAGDRSGSPFVLRDIFTSGELESALQKAVSPQSSER